jgi:hypothetical protein
LSASGVALSAFVIVAGCQSRAPEPAAQTEPEYRPTSTLQDVMLSVIDPAADAVWASVSVVIDEQGTLERAPKSDEEWATVRGHLIQIVEASNLIQMPGRPMARPGAKPGFPGIELEFPEIEKLINDNRADWIKHALALHDTSTAALKVVEAKDAEGLRDAGEKMYGSCETCHKKYWFPPRPMQTNTQ